MTGEDFIISNTYFKHPARNLTRWQGNLPNGDKIFNTADFIVLSSKLKHCLKVSKTISGIVTSSDHRLLITTLKQISNHNIWTKKMTQQTINHRYDYSETQNQTNFKNSIKNYINNAAGSDGDLNQLIHKITTEVKRNFPKIVRKEKAKKYYDEMVDELSRKQK